MCKTILYLFIRESKFQVNRQKGRGKIVFNKSDKTDRAHKLWVGNGLGIIHDCTEIVYALRMRLFCIITWNAVSHAGEGVTFDEPVQIGCLHIPLALDEILHVCMCVWNCHISLWNSIVFSR